MDDDQNNVVEGEIVGTPAVTVPAAGQTTLDLTGLINSYLDQVAHIKDELNKLRDMLQAVYENDSTYQTHEAAVKEASRVRNQTKKQIQKLPQVADLSNRVQNLRADLKEANQTLSGYLQDYARTTGSTTFETTDGQVRQIIYTAKLVSVSKPEKFF